MLRVPWFFKLAPLVAAVCISTAGAQDSTRTWQAIPIVAGGMHVTSEPQGHSAMVVGASLMFVTLKTPYLGWMVVLMTLAIIGVHGMLSGTATMDFGGKKNVGVVVGVIDGFVYLGTAVEALVLGRVLPKDELAHDPANWWTWPVVMVPAAVVGLALSARVWNARPKAKAFAAH